MPELPPTAWASLERELEAYADPPPFAELAQRGHRRRVRQRTLSMAAALVLLAGAASTAFALQRPTAQPNSLSTGGHHHSHTNKSVHHNTRPTPAPSHTTPPSRNPAPAGAGGFAFQPVSVTFVSPTVGWVYGAAANCARCGGALEQTRDGGASWVPIATTGIPPVAKSTAVHQSLRFGNGSDGWIWDNAGLWVTHDSGVNWQAIKLPGLPLHADVLDVESANTVTYALATDGLPGSPVNLYETPAGANDWQQRLQLPSTNRGQIVLQGADAWVFTPTGYFTSTDGVHWTQLNSPCGSTYGGDGYLAAASSNQLYVACAGLGAAGSQQKELFKSNDGGRTFSAAGYAPRHGGLYGLTATTPSTVVVAAFGGASWLDASFDGRSWHDAWASYAGGLPLFDLGFTTQSQGVAVFGRPGAIDQLLMTRDGGHTWQPVTFARVPSPTSTP